MPVLTTERIYHTYRSFLWTCTAFSAATWAFLIGGNLPIVGNTLIGIIGYLCGLILGLVPVTLASGLPSYRYGIDPIDAAKATFGVRGAVLPLVGALATLVGWTYVVMALTARGAVSLVASAGAFGAPSESLAVAVALLVLVAVWAIARRGPGLFKRLSQYVAPGQMLITTVLLALLLYHFGPVLIWTSNIAPNQALTHDHVVGFAYAVEFGVSNALTWWPVMGGLTRLVKHRHHVLGPSIIGVGVLGAAFISAVSALAATRAGTADPTRWLLALGGPVVGTLMLGFVLAANVVTMVILIYLAGVAIQQVRRLTRVPWDLLLAFLLAPGIYFAFRTTWVLDVVMNWLSYNGAMFAGITGIIFVDYFILRRQAVDAVHLFGRSPEGRYWYWGGVNWFAIATAIAATCVYFVLYNPTTFRVASAFRYLGAGIPTMALAGVGYYCIGHLIARWTTKGGYHATTVDRDTPVEVSL